MKVLKIKYCSLLGKSKKWNRRRANKRAEMQKKQLQPLVDFVVKFTGMGENE